MSLSKLESLLVPLLGVETSRENHPEGLCLSRQKLLFSKQTVASSHTEMGQNKSRPNHHPSQNQCFVYNQSQCLLQHMEWLP